jgi:F0F1-type ATP synthase delta subunit
MISRVKIAEVIGEQTLAGFDSKKLAEQIAAYLLSEGRVDELDSLVRDIIDYRAQHGILEVTSFCAHELTDQLKSEIEKLAQSYGRDIKKVILNERNDKQLIGGVKLRLANEQLDLTIRAKLNRFKQMTNQGKA